MELEEINQSLHKIALKKTIPFCYTCYKEALTGTCKICHSDDLMRLMPDFGLDWGTSWVINEILSSELESVDTSALFEQMIEDCYKETVNVGFLNLSTVEVMKSQDPTSWNIAKSEYVDNLVGDSQLITFDAGNNYYWNHDIESFIEENSDYC